MRELREKRESDTPIRLTLTEIMDLLSILRGGQKPQTQQQQQTQQQTQQCTSVNSTAQQLTENAIFESLGLLNANVPMNHINSINPINPMNPIFTMTHPNSSETEKTDKTDKKQEVNEENEQFVPKTVRASELLTLKEKGSYA